MKFTKRFIRSIAWFLAIIGIIDMFGQAFTGGKLKIIQGILGYIFN